MIIALASPRVATSLDDGLDKIERLLAEASVQGAKIVCFPECYLPGLRGVDIDVLPFGAAEEERVLQTAGHLWVIRKNLQHNIERTVRVAVTGPWTSSLAWHPLTP